MHPSPPLKMRGCLRAAIPVLELLVGHAGTAERRNTGNLQTQIDAIEVGEGA